VDGADVPSRVQFFFYVGLVIRILLLRSFFYTLRSSTLCTISRVPPRTIVPTTKYVIYRTPSSLLSIYNDITRVASKKRVSVFDFRKRSISPPSTSDRTETPSARYSVGRFVRTSRRLLDGLPPGFYAPRYADGCVTLVVGRVYRARAYRFSFA